MGNLTLGGKGLSVPQSMLQKLMAATKNVVTETVKLPISHLLV